MMGNKYFPIYCSNIISWNIVTLLFLQAERLILDTGKGMSFLEFKECVGTDNEEHR